MQIHLIVAIFYGLNQKGVDMRNLGLFFFIALAVELMSLFMMAKWIGFVGTLALILLGMMLGAALLRNNYGVTKVMMAGQFMRGGVSMYDMMLPIRIPLAGLLLALPTGFVSSVIGVLLLIPFRTHDNKHSAMQSDIFSDSVRQNGFEYTRRSPNQHQDDVIEGDYTVHNSKNPTHHKKDSDIIGHQP